MKWSHFCHFAIFLSQCGCSTQTLDLRIAMRVFYHRSMSLLGKSENYKSGKVHKMSDLRVSSFDNLVSGGTQGRVSFSRPNALLSTLILSLQSKLERFVNETLLGLLTEMVCPYKPCHSIKK
jgi:hypothetical protein